MCVWKKEKDGAKETEGGGGRDGWREGRREGGKNGGENPLHSCVGDAEAAERMLE